MMSLLELLITASGLMSTTYGFAEYKCGDIGFPVRCSYGAITASGEVFDPKEPQVAIAAPTPFRLKATNIWLKTEDGPCKKVRLVDKMNPRYIGVRGFDLSPAAVELLTGKPAHPRWSATVHVCAVPYELVSK